MNYELAKELKDAGWDQMIAGNGYLDIGNVVPPGFFNNWPPSVCAVPSLEELIEACGDGFSELVRSTNYPNGNQWQAYRNLRGEEMHSVPALGSTPTEAVARLWLALNHTEAAKS